MADTTYATPDQLPPRLGGSVTGGGSNPNVGELTPTLQSLLNAAAEKIDRETRAPRPVRNSDGSRSEAFSASGTLTRTYYDQPTGIILIDDLLTCTSVTRGTSVLDSTYYDFEPLNDAPKTRLVLHQDAPGVPLAFWNDRRYPRPWSGGATGLISIVGTWGYCTEANRPALVTELTLLLAERAWERIGKSPSDPALIAQEIASAWQGLDRHVKADLWSLRREGQALFA